MNPAETARGIIDANRYLVLATADADGRPWSSPVYFAHEAHREFFWISSPDALHSRNITVRPEVGISVFDSSAAIGTGQGVYMSAVAARLEGEGLAHGLDVFFRRSVRHAGRV
ncbi:pyridoxamine 5'-phosphate oxidase family protein [Streptomyces longisporus]|uniref:Pyridoxamine 5'-phosphate oxidase N-terminal domain-containing protein n=1 Tax=Streptomyces longisporus TaxID=1948 RepID=A0ABN3NFQ2_STRLO